MSFFSTIRQKYNNFINNRLTTMDKTAVQGSALAFLRANPELSKAELLKKISIGSLAELEAKLLKAADSLDASKGVGGEAVLARLRQRSKVRRQNA